jgi:hypothetical protein
MHAKDALGLGECNLTREKSFCRIEQQISKIRTECRERVLNFMADVLADHVRDRNISHQAPGRREDERPNNCPSIPNNRGENVTVPLKRPRREIAHLWFVLGNIASNSYN